jgi:hypothetical protein
MTQNKLKAEAKRLLALASRLSPEGEGIDLGDMDYTPEEMAQIRSYLSVMRRSIDSVNSALAKKWQLSNTDEVWDDGANTWYVSKSKGKRIIDTDLFYEWLETKDSDELSRLVSATAVKVGGMTPTERETLLDETAVNDRLSITSKPNNY